MTNEQETNITNRMDDIESAINNLDFSSPNYTQELRGIWNEIRHIADDYMDNISSDLRKLNKNQIVAAMITATKQTSLESLKKFSDLADKYLDYEAQKS